MLIRQDDGLAVLGFAGFRRATARARALPAAGRVALEDGSARGSRRLAEVAALLHRLVRQLAPDGLHARHA